jgi:hypothetical protein
MTIAKKGRVDTPVPFIPVAALPTVLAVLGYGRSGTGKTTFASTFPKPLLLLDIREKGTDSISNVPNVEIAHIGKWEDFEAVYWYLSKGGHKFKTVVVDQITQLQDLGIIKAMKDDGKEPEEAISKRNWGQAAGLMKTWLLNYRDLMDAGIHVVFLAHDRATTTDDDSGVDQIDPTVGARIMPSVASFLNGAVKVIGNTFIRETFSLQNKRKVRQVEFAMRIGPHSIYTTKTRSPVGISSPDIIVNPSFDKLVAVLQGEYSNGATSTVRKKK